MKLAGNRSRLFPVNRVEDISVLTLDETLVTQDRAAAAKVTLARRPLVYTVQSMLGGVYIGVAIVLMVSVAGPLLEAGSPSTKLVQGLVFGVALSLVFAAGAELVTSNMMTLPQGMFRKKIGLGEGFGTILFCFFGNMLGAFAFAAMVHFTGLLDESSPAGSMISAMLSGKADTSISQLFWRGVLCNMLVCLAMWSAARMTSESAKLIVIFWCLLAFISSGFEHVVANMTTYGIGLFSGADMTTWADFGRNMTVVGLGNLVGGAVIVGLAYAVSASKAVPDVPDDKTAPAQEGLVVTPDKVSLPN